MKNGKHFFFHFEKTVDFINSLRIQAFPPSHMRNHSESILTSVEKQTLTLYRLHYRTLYLETDKVDFQQVCFKYKHVNLG